MPSPFPGMNPYFENEYAWRDFYVLFLGAVAHFFSAQTAYRYVVLLQRQEYYRDISQDPTPRLWPKDADLPAVVPGSRNGAGTLQPVGVKLPLIEATHHDRLAIFNMDQTEIVTVIE